MGKVEKPSVKVSLDKHIPIPQFDIDKSFVHDDHPTNALIKQAEVNQQMIVTYVPVPIWVLMSLDTQFSRMLLDRFLKRYGVERSAYHVVMFCEMGADRDLLFKNYKQEMKDKITTDWMGFTSFSGVGNVAK